MSINADEIVDAAVALADEQGWEAVRLYQIAQRLDVPLAALQDHFREKEEIADAWFDRADRALLAAGEEPALQAMPSRERLEHLLMTWYQAHAAHRGAVRGMIAGKLEPGHLHVQLPAVLRISRTVQWLREAAERENTGLHRGLEETVLTGIFVTGFTTWLRDHSPGATRTRARVAGLLAAAERAARWLPGHRGAAAPAALPGPRVTGREPADA